MCILLYVWHFLLLNVTFLCIYGFCMLLMANLNKFIYIIYVFAIKYSPRVVFVEKCFVRLMVNWCLNTYLNRMKHVTHTNRLYVLYVSSLYWSVMPYSISFDDLGTWSCADLLLGRINIPQFQWNTPSSGLPRGVWHPLQGCDTPFLLNTSIRLWQTQLKKFRLRRAFVTPVFRFRSRFY